MPLFSVCEVTSQGRKAWTSGFVNPAGVVAWALQLFVLTTPGVIISVVMIAAWLWLPGQPWRAAAAPLYLLPLLFFLFISMIVSLFTQLATEWVFGKFWGDPDPANLTHRIGFFMLSVPVFAVVAIIFGFNAGGGCSGPDRYCS